MYLCRKLQTLFGDFMHVHVTVAVDTSKAYKNAEV